MTVKRLLLKKNPIVISVLAFVLFAAQMTFFPSFSSAATNLALGKPITAGNYTQTYVATNANDGNQGTYWEGGAYPSWIRVDLGATSSVNQVVLKLPSAWGSRTQTLSIQGSTNDSTYTDLAASTTYTFTPSANTVTINFTDASVRYVKVNITANSGATGGQISEFEVYGTQISTNGTYEAEAAALSGGAKTNTDHTGYTGTGFVDGYLTAGPQTLFTVTAASAGNYNVALRYANASGSVKTLSVYVNGTKIRQTSLPNLANWDTWSTKTETLTLNAGSNTIAYKYDTTDSGNVNLDQIVVTSAGSTPTPTPTATPTAT
ncbi:MAG: glycosyl hydrolase, partial [Bacilli bacterium]|nr:glycosyl hydrolase [Bacilli bacterium]